MKESLIANYLLSTQDMPEKCENPVSNFYDEMKGRIISQVRSAHHYYLNSKDPGVGNDYTERMANFQIENGKTFSAFMKARRLEYQKTLCSYSASVKANAGDTKTATLTAQTGFHFIPASIVRTQSGEWKGGPYYYPNETEPTSFSWKTGGNRSSRTNVKISAKYKEDFIKSSIEAEIAVATKELNDLGIPVDIPPFLNE